MKNALRLSLFVAFSVAACGGAEEQADVAADDMMATRVAPPNASVSITAPADGSEVMGSSVTVQLEVSSMPIVPATDPTPGTGHHHLFLDADLTDASVPVPTVPNSIIHMGDASSSFTFEDLTPGEHRIIAVVADFTHFPLQPWVVDTVTFTVR